MGIEAGPDARFLPEKEIESKPEDPGPRQVS